MTNQRVPSVSDRLSPDLRSAKESLISVISVDGGRRFVDRSPQAAGRELPTLSFTVLA